MRRLLIPERQIDTKGLRIWIDGTLGKLEDVDAAVEFAEQELASGRELPEGDRQGAGSASRQRGSR